MQVPDFVFGCFALLAILILPILSTKQIHFPTHSAIGKYLRVLIVYAAITFAVQFGFGFQNISLNFLEPGTFMGKLQWFKSLLTYSGSMSSLPMVALDAAIISYITLSHSERNQRAIQACRGAFVLYTIGDILTQINIAGKLSDYLTCIVFNLVGAVLCGPFAALIANRIIPPAQNTTENDPVTA